MKNPTDVVRMRDLERRVALLEEMIREVLWINSPTNSTEQLRNTLLLDHGEYVDKVSAAQILGVTRATVYAMLDDGRITAACGGSKVSVRIIADYIADNSNKRRRKKKNEGNPEKLSG